MNGCSKLGRHFSTHRWLHSVCKSSAVRPNSFGIGRQFSRTLWVSTRSYSPASNSPTPLTDFYTSLPALDPDDTPLMRRALLITNIPSGAQVQDLLDLVHTGAIEYVKFTTSGKTNTAELSFLSGHGAAAFFALNRSLRLSGRTLEIKWLPYRPLHPVVAMAVERDQARRALVLYKADERLDNWAPAQLRVHLGQVTGGYVEDLEVHEMPRTENLDWYADVPPKEDVAYREIAVLYFTDIVSAIRAHARIRADPFMTRVHVAYCPDRCEAARLSREDCDALLEIEPTHAPTYFAPTSTYALPPGSAYPLPTTLDWVQMESPMFAASKGATASNTLTRHGLDNLTPDTSVGSEARSTVPAYPFTSLLLTDLHPATTLDDLCNHLYGGPLWGVWLNRKLRTAAVSFFRAEDARDFYYTAVSGAGFTIWGRRVEVTVRAEKTIVRRGLGTQDDDLNLEGKVLPPQDTLPAPDYTNYANDYTRVLRVRLPGHFWSDPAAPRMLRSQIRRDFGKFGEVVRVTTFVSSSLTSSVHSGYVHFARAADARKALSEIAVVHPEYLGCNIRFWADPCARSIPREDLNVHRTPLERIRARIAG
ncbi:hypothetical protein C8R43DRAFT_543762 [Mycena crocata]|nr:hypothetical protein C8R43DRAFT_543762 [Mycena crocata]